MSINPVHDVRAVVEGPQLEGPRPRAAAPAVQSAGPAAEAHVSNQRAALAHSGDSSQTASNPPAEQPEDVQVDRDSEVSDQIVIRYIDKANGSVILQVPSSQVLNVARGIYQDFQREARSRAAEGETVLKANQGHEHGH